MFKPAAPVARRGATLRVQTSLAGGHVQSVDVLWGEGDTRDHFTLAPALRRSSHTFTLRHRYKRPGRYRLTVRTYGYTGDCKRGSRAARPLVRVVSA